MKRRALSKAQIKRQLLKDPANARIWADGSTNFDVSGYVTAGTLWDLRAEGVISMDWDDTPRTDYKDDMLPNGTFVGVPSIERTYSVTQVFRQANL